jgi:diguanylate cyclase (GGDEF)-like protein
MAGATVPAMAVVELIDEATRRGWSDVAREAMHVDVLRTWDSRGSEHLEAIARAHDRAEATGDVAGVANALALRARALYSSHDPAVSLTADADLARATVLAEAADGHWLQQARAHFHSAIAYAHRDLWELSEKHNLVAAALVDGDAENDRFQYSIAWNRAEAQLNWICALRELGDDDAIAHRTELAADAVRIAQALPMPATWQQELLAFAALLGAIAPSFDGPDPAQVSAEGLAAGCVHLARAMSVSDRTRACDEARAAIATLDPDTFSRMHSLARCVAAEIEAASVGRETAGLRYARQLGQLRWTTRLSSLAAIESMIDAERLRGEHTRLSQHAGLDDLTQLSNRRGLRDWLAGLIADGVGSVALLLVDLDSFKAINDTHGHVAGDQTLIRVASTLSTAVRPGDLAIRLGGDEFALVIPSIDADNARRRAQAILTEISTAAWGQISQGLHVTVSIGVALGTPEQFDALAELADGALYRSKAAGRNRIELADQLPTRRFDVGRAHQRLSDQDGVNPRLGQLDELRPSPQP